MDSKFKVIRLPDLNQIEPTLNEFSLGNILDVSVSMPDYRVVVLVIRYEPTPEESKDAKNDKAAK